MLEIRSCLETLHLHLSTGHSPVASAAVFDLVLLHACTASLYCTAVFSAANVLTSLFKCSDLLSSEFALRSSRQRCVANLDPISARLIVESVKLCLYAHRTQASRTCYFIQKRWGASTPSLPR